MVSFNNRTFRIRVNHELNENQLVFNKSETRGTLLEERKKTNKRFTYHVIQPVVSRR
uniref:Uncharacterized protein n=1 Tax=Tetranychus urticae TaxID=32264 RepID=T1K9J5_TETUR